MTYPHLEQKTGIPKNLNDPKNQEWASAISEWLSAINAGTKNGLSPVEHEKEWRDHRTQRGIELGIIWRMAYNLEQIIGLSLRKNIQIKGRLGEWDDDIHRGIDGFLILPTGEEIGIDVTSSALKLDTYTQIKGSDKLLHFVKGAESHALARALNDGLQRRDEPENIIATFNSHGRQDGPIGTTIALNPTNNKPILIAHLLNHSLVNGKVRKACEELLQI